MPSVFSRAVVIAAVGAALLLSACQPQQVQTPQQNTGTAEQPAASPQQQAPAPLQDTIEYQPGYMVGITYPPLANKYPGLTQVLREYSAQARKDLEEAEGNTGSNSDLMYELSLQFTEVADTPQFAAMAASGTLFVGGAHGNPLVARWVWLPQQDKMLTAANLIPDAQSWNVVAEYVRKKLLDDLAQRVEEGDMEESEVRSFLRNGREMIMEGTEPVLENYDEFEPLISTDGRLSGLRFVFPPYQVGPYAYGEQSAEVPAAVLLPLVAEEYRVLFVSP